MSVPASEPVFFVTENGTAWITVNRLIGQDDPAFDRMRESLNEQGWFEMPEEKPAIAGDQ